MDVIIISLSFFSNKNDENSLSIISALVATVPRLFFSIIVKSDASFNLEGGFVLPSVFDIDSTSNFSPSLNIATDEYTSSSS